MISQLEHAAGFLRDDTTEQKLAKLDVVLARSSAEPEAIGLIADLLSSPTRYPMPELSPQQRKEKTLPALLAQVDGLARKHPVLILFEDMHWIDPTSLELLTADNRSGAGPAGPAGGDRSSGVYATLAQPSPCHRAVAGTPEPTRVCGIG